MRTRPDGVADADLARLVEEAWAFPVVDLQHVAVGFGSHHWVATDANGRRRFVTVDLLFGDRAWEDRDRLTAAMSTAHALRVEGGLDFVVAPLPAADGSLLHYLDDRCAVALLPYVDGREWPETEAASEGERAQVGELLARLHAATAAAAPYARRDDLRLDNRSDLEQALHRRSGRWSFGPYAEGTRELLDAHAAMLAALLAEYDRLVGAVTSAGPAWVVTHGEPKPDNVLATDAGPVLIDWDTALLAPAARDLWWLDDVARQAYVDAGGRRPDEDALTLYRLRWDLADIAVYVCWFGRPHEDDADTAVGWESLVATLQRDRWWSALL